MKAAVVKSPLARHPQIVSTFARSKKRKLSTPSYPATGTAVFSPLRNAAQNCGFEVLADRC